MKGAALASACDQPIAALLSQLEPAAECRPDALWVASRCAAAGGHLSAGIKRLGQIAAEHPDAARAADAIHQLGVEYQSIARFSDAAAAFERLSREYPRDPRSADALARVFELRRELGDRAAASAAADRFQSLFGRTRPHQAARIEWARGALIDVGDHAARYEHARVWLKKHGRKAGPDLRAQAEVTIGEQLLRRACGGRDPAEGCFTRALARRPSAAPGRSSLERAQARVDELTWRQQKRAEIMKELSKNSPGVRPSELRVQYELRAATIRRKRAAFVMPARCGASSSAPLVVHPREQALVERARRHFDRVLALHRRGGRALLAQLESDADGRARKAGLLDAVARASLYSADLELTEYLQLGVPEGLNFYVEDWRHDSGSPKWERIYEQQVAERARSTKALKRFYSEKQRRGAALRDRYAEVVKLAVPRWSAMASARAGLVFESFADELRRAPLPGSFKVEEEYNAFCDALDQQAAPLQRLAAGAYKQCVTLGARVGADVELQRACARAVEQLAGQVSGEPRELYSPSSLELAEVSPQRVGVVIE